MRKASAIGVGHGDSLRPKGGFVQRLPLCLIVALAFAILMTATGCQTAPVVEPTDAAADHPEVMTLREGDVVKISFPGAPNLDTTQEIRRDGKIVLSLIGEVTAADLTPAELERVILQLYSSQLVSKEVTVTVISSSFPVFVTGAVIKPGKVLSNHPMTAMEAVMEAGGFNYSKANLGAVVVIRHEEGRVKNYTLNLRLVLEGKQSKPFYLKPSDIVYVPERFTWF